MELKRIVAEDTRAAIALATGRYGKDALIVSNERVNGRVEIVVAVDLGDPLDESWFESGRLASGEVLADDEDSRVSASARVRPEAGALAGQPMVQRADAVFGQLLDDQLERPAGSPRASAPGASIDEGQRARDLVDLIRGELTELRREFRLSTQIDLWQPAQGLAPEVRPVVDALHRAGVPAALRGLLIDEVRGSETRKDALAAIEASLRGAIGGSRKSPPLSGIHLLAGPAGAGKSTMVARLAAAHSGEAAFGADGVALVSYRDSRPGAWGQLQILAAQAGVESFRATNAEVLAHLLQELSARRLVLIDTPASQIEVAVNDLRRMAPEARAHLVLPLEASQFTVQRHLRLEGVRWDGLMISRMDQVASPWPILQVLCGGELPVSFGGFGAELGDLIEAADADLLVDRARTTLELALEEQLAPIAND